MQFNRVLSHHRYFCFHRRLSYTKWIHSCADDTAILSSHDDLNVACQTLQVHRNKMQDWHTKWRLQVNVAKFQHTTFAFYGNTSGFTWNYMLKRSNVIKYLGFHLERRLTWKQHAMAKKNKWNKKIHRSTVYWVTILNFNCWSKYYYIKSNYTNMELWYSTMGHHY